MGGGFGFVVVDVVFGVAVGGFVGVVAFGVVVFLGEGVGVVVVFLGVGVIDGFGDGFAGGFDGLGGGDAVGLVVIGVVVGSVLVEGVNEGAADELSGAFKVVVDPAADGGEAEGADETPEGGAEGHGELATEGFHVVGVGGDERHDGAEDAEVNAGLGEAFDPSVALLEGEKPFDGGTAAVGGHELGDLFEGDLDDRSGLDALSHWVVRREVGAKAAQRVEAARELIDAALPSAEPANRHHDHRHDRDQDEDAGGADEQGLQDDGLGFGRCAEGALRGVDVEGNKIRCHAERSRGLKCSGS